MGSEIGTRINSVLVVSSADSSSTTLPFSSVGTGNNSADQVIDTVVVSPAN
jgi:hypothetical protein